MIPSFDLKAQCQQLKKDVLAAVERVIDSGAFILGPEVKKFEEEFVAWNGVAYGCGCASGTDALHLACRALELKPQDEVICPAFTYMATASAVSLAGGTPVFVDVHEDTWNIDASQVEAKITPKTRAIIGVHLYGNPCDIEALMAIAKKHNIALIEDCAQSVGATINGKKVGTFGDFGCFSFFPTKNLGAYGDGGFMLTQTLEMEKRIRSIRAQGQDREKYFHDRLGTNSRLDEMQAAILRVKLPHLTAWGQARGAHAEKYSQALEGVAGLQLPKVRPNNLHVYHQYTILVENRDQVQASLKSKGVGSTVYYPRCLHLQDCYKHLGYAPGSLPVAERLQSQALSLPMFPELTAQDLQTSIEAVKQVVGQLATTG